MCGSCLLFSDRRHCLRFCLLLKGGGLSFLRNDRLSSPQQEFPKPVEIHQMSLPALHGPVCGKPSTETRKKSKKGGPSTKPINMTRVTLCPGLPGEAG